MVCIRTMKKAGHSCANQASLVSTMQTIKKIESQWQSHIGYFGGFTVEVPRRRFGVPAVICGRQNGGGDDVGGNEDVAAKDEVVGHRLVVDVRAENGIDDLVVKAHLENVTESKASLDLTSPTFSIKLYVSLDVLSLR